MLPQQDLSGCDDPQGLDSFLRPLILATVLGRVEISKLSAISTDPIGQEFILAGLAVRGVQ